MSAQTPLNTERQRYPSSNDWGIPDLLPHKLATTIPSGTNPVVLFRSVRLSEATAANAIVAYYVDDYRFICCWSYPARMLSALLNAKIAAAIEPDFSLWADAPRAQQLDAIYRTRWVGRYWQEHGISVIPSLNWSDAWSYDYAWLGIPASPPVASVECRSCGANRSGFNDGLAAACETVCPKTLLIYGDHNDWVRIPSGVQPMWVEPATNRRFRMLKAGK